MDKMVLGIHHVALRCAGLEEFEETVRFYTELLGMEVYRRWGTAEKTGIMISTGAGCLEIFADGTGEKDAKLIEHIALRVADVDACFEKITGAGYKAMHAPNDIIIASEPPLPARIAFVYGAAGEIIELFDEK